MTDLNNEVFELAVEELDQVSGGGLNNLSNEHQQRFQETAQVNSLFKILEAAQNQINQNMK